MNGAALSIDSLPEFRAGGTDLSERRRSGVSRGPLIDLTPTVEMIGVHWSPEGAARIGSMSSVSSIAADKQIEAAYPGLAAAAAGLATPQIRNVATLGGNLAQRTRCWYYRNPHIACLKKGGATCPARAGNHLFGLAFDSNPCVAPHPSTLGAALLAYDAAVDTNMRRIAIAPLLDGGSEGKADNALARGEIITSVSLPPPLAGERALYKRAISREHAEWPLVEVVARAVVSDGVIRLVRLVAGGVAAAPLRLVAVEKALEGGPAAPAAILDAAAHCADGAKLLPATAYKVDLMKGLVRDLMEALVR
jgi:xanthine dehydrogenase YagS FAD-binding subunit